MSAAPAWSKPPVGTRHRHLRGLSCPWMEVGAPAHAEGAWAAGSTLPVPAGPSTAAPPLQMQFLYLVIGSQADTANCSSCLPLTDWLRFCLVFLFGFVLVGFFFIIIPEVSNFG